MKWFQARINVWLPVFLLMVIAGAPEISMSASLAQERFKGIARTDARIQRLVMIGQLCRKLTEEDAQAILANSRAELEAARAKLANDEQEWARIWQEGVFIGATQAADIPDAVYDAGCAHFARPDGPLTAIMTWSGKSQSGNDARVPRRAIP
ncbi:hypothetical protein [Brucella intermedia]|uniref:hypothetical protein n=1 Tax=Brucella intermedia TaxID=94625 RepID=UPI00224B3463|nr:hypothetical protein [Brucella intermedia]